MIKSIVLHDIPWTHIAAVERWYYRDHGPEIARRFGPWLARLDSYLPVAPPVGGKAVGFLNWRVTESYWREMPAPGAQGNLAFTLPPVPAKGAACFVPPQPTEDFLGGQIQPGEKSVLRWCVLFRYPEGVSIEDGERWFLDVHAPELVKSSGAYRFFSYRVLQEKIALPGSWPPGFHGDIVGSGWRRYCELWYEGFDQWQKAVIDSPPAYTRPPWAASKAYPFFEPYTEFVSSFLLERPNDEFLRDARGYLHLTKKVQSHGSKPSSARKELRNAQGPCSTDHRRQPWHGRRYRSLACCPWSYGRNQLFE